MIFRNNLHRRIFAVCLFLLFGGAVLTGFLKFGAMPCDVFFDNEKSEEAENEAARREEGLRFRRLTLQDEKGVIDPNGLRNARQHIEEMKKVQAARALQKQNRIQEAGIYPDSWTWLGPGNIGGRIRSISIRPDNANDILVGSVSGGIWRTLDGGANWFPVDDFMANLAVTTLVRNPTNFNQIYAGTGEGVDVRFTSNFPVDGIQGAGIFRSNDGGTTWQQLASTNNPNFNYVNRLAISPNGTTILAATSTGVWRSTDGGATPWSQRTFAQALDIDFHPTDSTRAIVGELGTAKFTTDGGVTWSAANFTPGITSAPNLVNNGRVETAYWRIGGLIVYASVNNNNGEIYRSTDGGQNYTRVNTGTNYMLGGGGNQGWYDNALWINPQDPNFIVVGGIHLYLSTDGGSTLTQISDGSDSAHADHHYIAAHPAFNNSTNKIVFFANDGGLYRADDVSTATMNSGWTSLNNNLGITQFYGAAGNVFGTIVGGTQDNGTLRYSGNSNNWRSTAGADGGFVAADQTDRNYFYGETQNLGVFRSSDGGLTSTPISTGIGDAPPNCGQPSQPACQTNFIAPLVLDPNEPTRLLAGGWSLWRTNNARDAAPAWNSIKAPTGGNSPISAIAVSPNNPDFIAVGHNNGDIYYTFAGTTVPAPPPNQWIKIDTAGLPDRFVTRLVIDTTRAPNWIYATFGGFLGDNVWVTRNLGATWSDVTGAVAATGLPNVPVRTLAIHPHNPNLLYVGTEVGIFTSEDAGATWDLPNGGPANVSVDELFWVFGDLIAATHGRGLFRASGGVYVDCNYTGEQFGTFDKPFRTINAAINSISTFNYKPVWLKACVYNESVSPPAGKRFELRSLGGATVVGQ